MSEQANNSNIADYVDHMDEEAEDPPEPAKTAAPLSNERDPFGNRIVYPKFN